MTAKTRSLRHYDILRTGDIITNADGEKFQVMDDEGGVLTVRRPNGTASKMMPSLLHMIGKKLTR